MSNYTQINDYSAKDALPSGDPAKKITGADIDGELAAIATAIASKADDNVTVKLTAAQTLTNKTLIDPVITGALDDEGATIQPPVGSLIMYVGSSAPTGWLLCDGSAVSRTTYAALFNVIGTAYGSGDGSTTFNLPDFRGRSPLGVGQGDTAEGGGTGTNRTLGQKVGAETHSLTEAQNGPHDHGYQRWNDTNDYTDGGSSGAGRTLGSFTTTSSGSGDPHNNMHPSLVVNFIIKY